MSGQYLNEPAWLLAAVDQRLALITDRAGSIIKLADAATVIFTPLTEPLEDTDRARQHWEHCCDNCQCYCPGTLRTGTTTRTVKGTQVIISFGICPACLEAK